MKTILAKFEEPQQKEIERLLAAFSTVFRTELMDGRFLMLKAIVEQATKDQFGQQLLIEYEKTKKYKDEMRAVVATYGYELACGHSIS